MGTMDSSALFLSAEKKSNITRVEENFAGVADAQQRHGWRGRREGDMGNTCMQWRVRGWLVACGGESEVKATEKEETTKWMARKKKRQIRQICPTKKKSKNVHQRSLGESTHDPNQEGSDGRPFNREYLRKGPRCPITGHNQVYIGTSPEGLCAKTTFFVYC
jgi:hypothetical protein